VTVDDIRPARSRRAPWGPPTTPPGVPASIAFGPAFRPPRPAHSSLPLAPGLGALIVLTVSLLGSKYVLDVLVDLSWPIAVYVALLAAIGYGPSVVWCVYASRRWGSGSLRDDLGFRLRWSDLGWGPLIWLTAVMLQTAVGLAVFALGVPVANNTDGISEVSSDRTYVVAIVISAVVAAPLVEELVFRGLVLRSLLSRLHAVAAVVVQAVLFGAAHADPVRGVGNVGLVVILTAVGIAFGGGAFLLRRIGPTIVAHAIFNGVVMLLLLTGVRDRLLEENPDLFDTRAPAASHSDASATSISEEWPIVDEPDVAEPHRGRDSSGSR
jgi:membrane protease YdiL (CAAX protease family)